MTVTRSPIAADRPSSMWCVGIITAVIFTLVLCRSGVEGISLTNSTPDQQNSSMTTDAPLTTENFILIDISEIGRLLRSLKLRPIGRFENKPVFVDRNNTRYLVVMKPMEKQIQELHEKLANNTDNGLVCVTGICMDTDSAKSYMDKLAAKVAISVSPSELLPFSLMVTTFIAVAVLGVIGNVLIITGVGCRKTLRNSTSVFLCGLAVFDIFVLALGLPLQVVKVFFAVQSINADVCRAYEFMRHFSIITSTLTMTVMSIERYIAICHPLKAKSYCTVKNARNCTAGIWVVCIGCCIPLVVADYTGKGGCGAPYRDLSMLIVYHVAVSIAVFGLPLMVMLPLYLRIFIVLWLSSQKAEEMKSQSDATNPMNSDSSVNMRKQVIKMLAVALVVFILCWGPAMLYDLVMNIYQWKDLVVVFGSARVSIALNSLGICNSFFNPLIYFTFSRQFRKYVLSLCPCSPHRQKGNKTERSRGSVKTTSTSQLSESYEFRQSSH